MLLYRTITAGKSSMRANIIVTILGLVCGFIIAEISLRILAQMNIPVASNIPLSIPDSDVGVIYPKNMHVKRFDRELSHYVDIKINSHGYRDDEWDLDSKNSYEKIMFVGDSFVAALQVEKDERFTEQLEEKLNLLGKSVEVFNFGRSGSGPESYLLTLKKWFPIVKPDLVVFVIFNGNDFTDLQYDITPNSGRVNYKITEDGSIVSYSSLATRKEKIIWSIKLILGKSYVAQFAKLANTSLHKSSLNYIDNSEDRTQVTSLFCKEGDQLLRNSDRILEYIIDEAYRITNGDMMILQIPVKKQETLDFHDCVSTLPEITVAKIAEKNKIPLVQLLFRMSEGTELYYASHFNLNGHEFVAQELFDFILQLDR